MLIWGLRLICLQPVEESYDKGRAFPGGGGGEGTAIYGLYGYCAAVKGMVFKQFTLG